MKTTYLPLKAGDGEISLEMLDAVPESGSMPIIVNAAKKMVLPGGTPGTGRALIYGADGSVAWSAGPVALESALPTRETLGLATTDTPVFAGVNLSTTIQNARIANNGGGIDLYTGFPRRVWQFFHDGFLPGTANTCNIGVQAYDRPFAEVFATKHVGRNYSNPASNIWEGKDNTGAVKSAITGAGAATFSGNVTTSGNLSSPNGFAEGFIVQGNGSIRIGSGVAQNINGSGFCSTSRFGLNASNATGAPDVEWTRGSTGPTADARAAGGFRSRNLANDADAPITASTGTFSGVVNVGSVSDGGVGDNTLGTIKRDNQYNYYYIDSGSFRLGSSSVQRWFPTINVLGAHDIELGRGATGPTYDVRCAGGLRSRNLNNTADAPITASAATLNGGGYFSPAITLGSSASLYADSNSLSVVTGGQVQAAIRENALSVRSAGSFAFTGATSAGGTIDAKFVRGATGPTLDACSAGGFRVRNFANDAPAPITAGNGEFSYVYANNGARIAGDLTFTTNSVWQDNGRIQVSSVGSPMVFRAGGGHQFRNTDNTANAPITASNITASGNLTHGGGLYGSADWQAFAGAQRAIRFTTNTVFFQNDNVAIKENGLFFGNNVSSRGLFWAGSFAWSTPETSLLSPSSGVIAARNGNNTQDAAMTASALTLSLGTTFRGGPDDPTATDIPAGVSTLWNNTTTSELKLWANVSGTLKSVLLS